MRIVNALRRIGVSVVTALALILATAGPASAHTVSGQGATNYRSTLVGVSPSVPGLAVSVVNLGSNLRVRWTGSAELTIFGYQGEPYLRIGPEGVYRNRLSPATYLNVTRTLGAIPPYADAGAPPDWVKLSSGRTVLWHDHRIHWMGGPTPPPVAAAPGSFHHVVTWTVKMTEGTTPVVATGSLDWVPGSSPWPWVGIIVVLAAMGIIAGASRRWAEALLVFVAVIVAADIVHAVGTGVFAAGSVTHKLLVTFTGSYYSVVAWVLGAVGIRLLARRSVDGLFAAVFTALVIGLFGGLADVVTLGRSQVPYEWGVTAAQILIAVSIGMSAGVVVGSIIAFRLNRPAPVFDPDAPPDAAFGAAGAGG
jgi:hypothetical protein